MQIFLSCDPRRTGCKGTTKIFFPFQTSGTCSDCGRLILPTTKTLSELYDLKARSDASRFVYSVNHWFDSYLNGYRFEVTVVDPVERIWARAGGLSVEQAAANAGRRLDDPTDPLVWPLPAVA